MLRTIKSRCHKFTITRTSQQDVTRKIFMMFEWKFVNSISFVKDVTIISHRAKQYSSCQMVTEVQKATAKFRRLTTPYYFYKTQKNQNKENCSYENLPKHNVIHQIYKIIDFGRAIYSFKGVQICSDSFHKEGDADA